MEAIALKKYVGISRRKIARLARECIRLTVSESKMSLMILPQKAARELLKTILSASSNYQTKNPNANVEELKVKHIYVDKGPTMKRMLPRAKGRADRIFKRSSHIKVVLTDGNENQGKKQNLKQEKSKKQNLKKEKITKETK